MDRWEYANVVLGCFCIVVSLLPTGYLISNNRYKRRLYLFFLLICVANILMAVGSLPEYLLDAFCCSFFCNTFLNTCGWRVRKGGSAPPARFA